MGEDLDVELTEEEVAWAIIEAKNKKRTKMQYEQNEILRRKAAEELYKPFTPEQLIFFCEKFYYERFKKEFLFDESNTKLVDILSQYFCYNRNPGYDLDKGIMLMGNVGSGKTSLMAFFQKNKKQCYTIKACNDISDEYLIYKNPDEIINIYTTPYDKPLHDPSVFFQKSIGYCFDDLGTEEVKNSFGNKKNVMLDILLSLYNKKDYSKFHITTNLTEEEIKGRYGSRVHSRMNEMFNVFVLNGTDRRKL